MTDARSGLGLDHGKGQSTINSASVGKQKLTSPFPKCDGTRPQPFISGRFGRDKVRGSVDKGPVTRAPRPLMIE
jgi:hypothetical protein